MKICLIIVLLFNIFVVGLSFYAQAGAMARYSNVYELLEEKNIQLSSTEKTKLYGWFKDLRGLNESTAYLGILGAATSFVCILKAKKSAKQ